MPGKKNDYTSKESNDMLQLLEKEIKSCINNGSTGALLHISIDNLPMIISSQSGDFAEELMDDITKKISKSLAKTDIVARAGKDYINVILKKYPPEKMDKTAMEIHTLIQNYGCINSPEPIQITSTIGAVDFPGTSRTAQDAINKSYIALNDAREAHKHYMCYINTEKHEIESKNQMILASYIQNAFLNDKLRLAFQPIVSAKTGEIGYYESLLRIVNEDGTTSSAGPFIPVAEKMGFIDVIDSMVLKMVVDELHKSRNVTLSVNVSNASMYDSGWLSMAINLLDDPSVTSRLIIEITETSEQHNVKKASHFVETMRELGCKIALDDFGTGYTSFSQLKNLPIDIIKIDGSFVKDITYNKENRFFVQTLLDFSQNFGLKTVAEFVENQEIANILTEMKVDYMQGNYFSPAVNYRDWIDRV